MRLSSADRVRAVKPAPLSIPGPGTDGNPQRRRELSGAADQCLMVGSGGIGDGSGAAGGGLPPFLMMWGVTMM